MDIYVAVLGDESLARALSLISRSKVVPPLLCRAFERMPHDLPHVSAVIIDSAGMSPDGLFDLVYGLRFERGFRGSISLLSFAASPGFVRHLGNGAHGWAGCSYFRLPALLENLVDVLSRRVMLSDSDLEAARCGLRALKVAERASSVAHDLKNRFSLGLTHLRELEKYSYFEPYPAAQVVREIRAARTHITGEKVRQLRAAVEGVAEAARPWDKDAADRVLATFDHGRPYLESWLKASEEWGDGHGAEPGDIFVCATRTRAAIKAILDQVQELGDGARREISHAK